MNQLRQRIGFVFGFTLLAISGAFLVELLLSSRPDQAFGHTQRGHLPGWVGLAVTMLVFGYSLRKRYGLKWGTLKSWLQVHLIAGVVGPLLILVHSGAHFHALVPMLAMAAMVIVVVSGIVGQGIHLLALRTLNRQRRQFVEADMDPDVIEAGLDELASQEQVFRWWRAIQAPLTMTFAALVVLHVFGALFFGGL